MQEDPYLTVVRHRIRQARLVRGLRQEDVADLCEMPLRSYQRFEALKPDKGRFNPSLLTLRRIAGALEVGLEELVGEPSQKELTELTALPAKRIKRHR